MYKNYVKVHFLSLFSTYLYSMQLHSFFGDCESLNVSKCKNKKMRLDVNTNAQFELLLVFYQGVQ